MKPLSQRLSRGFTLIELMVVVAIVGVAVALGLPSFVPLISKIRMDGEISALQSGINLARSEAVKRGLTVSVCPSTDGSTCATTANWSSGWIVSLNGATTQVLQVTAALSRDSLSSTSSATPSYPQFTSMGYTFFTGALTLHDPTNSTDLNRCIVFASGSWVSNKGAACP